LPGTTSYWGLWVVGLMLAIAGVRYLLEGRLMKSATRARQVVRDVGATRRLRERLSALLKGPADQPAHPDEPEPASGETVYLRPFALADLLAWTHHEEESESVATLEKQLTSAIAPGSLLAIGDAGPDDASVHVLSDDAAWKDYVQAALAGATRIVVVPWPSPGVLWELAFLRDARMLSRCIFVMPPPLAADPETAIADRWEEVRAHARAIGLEFPGYRAGGCLFALSDDGAVRRWEPFWVHDVSELSRSIRVLSVAPSERDGQLAERPIRCRTPANLRWRNKLAAVFLASLGCTLAGLGNLLDERAPSMGGAMQGLGIYLMAMVGLAILLRGERGGKVIFIYLGLLGTLALLGLLFGRGGSAAFHPDLGAARPWMLLGGGLVLAATVLFTLRLLRRPWWAVLGDDIRIVAPMGHSRRSTWSDVEGISALSTRRPSPHELSFRDGQTIQFTPCDDRRLRDLVRRHGVVVEPPPPQRAPT
jgi:hypothetical protein